MFWVDPGAIVVHPEPPMDDPIWYVAPIDAPDMFADMLPMK